MATAGCDGSSHNPATPTYWGAYDPWLWWNACEQCDWDATTFGALGYRTWCWETVPNGQRAELWLGRMVKSGEPGTAGEPRKLTEAEIAELRQAVANR